MIQWLFPVWNLLFRFLCPWLNIDWQINTMQDAKSCLPYVLFVLCCWLNWWDVAWRPCLLSPNSSLLPGLVHSVLTWWYLCWVQACSHGGHLFGIWTVHPGAALHALWYTTSCCQIGYSHWSKYAPPRSRLNIRSADVVTASSDQFNFDKCPFLLTFLLLLCYF